MARKLWSEIDGEPWLDNPRRRRKGRKGRKRRRTRARAAHHRRTRRSRKGRMPAALKAYWANKRAGRATGGHVKRRRRAASRRGRRRAYRTNPLGGRSWTGKVMEGVKGGLGVVVGKAAARAIPTLIGQPRTGIVGLVLQAGVGVLLAPMVAKFGGSDFSRAFLYGAFAGPIESLAIGANLPVLSPALSSYSDELGALPPGRSTLGADPGAGMPGFTIDEEEQQLIQ